MNSLTDFNPSDVAQQSTPPPDEPEAMAGGQVAQIPPEQMEALGITGAVAGQSYTVTFTVNRADEQGAEIRVDNTEENAAPEEPAGGEEEPMMGAPMTRPKPAIVGPGKFKGGF